MSTDSREINDTDDSAPPVRHPQFYFDNTLVVIQIEKVLFNVHKYQLVKSETFRDMFALAEQAGTHGRPAEGSSPDYPIKMEGVSAKDFECLLTVLYANHFSSHQPEPKASLIIPAFRLANMWNFADLRAYLMPLAEKNLGDVDKIAFAWEFDIKDWLAPAHVRLCQRPEPLTMEEAKKLGLQSVLLIFRMREQFRPPKPDSASTSYFCPGCVHLTYYNGAVDCSTCGYRSNPGFYNIGAANYSSTNTALTNKVKSWVEAGFTLTE